MVKFCNFCCKNQNFEPEMAIFNYSDIRSLLFEYSNIIPSPKSDWISNRTTLFGTQLFEYSNNLNYSFKHWTWHVASAKSYFMVLHKKGWLLFLSFCVYPHRAWITPTRHKNVIISILFALRCVNNDPQSLVRQKSSPPLFSFERGNIFVQIFSRLVGHNNSQIAATVYTRMP